VTYKSYHDATTRTSVLRAITNKEDEASWTRFFDLYAGFVFAIGRSKGLSAADADDVVQDVFADLSRKMQTFEYDPGKGRFRSYLLALVNWRALDKLKSRKREFDLKAGYSGEQESACDAVAELEEREWQTAAMNEALRRLQAEARPEHFAVFVESTIEGMDTETVMRLHGITRDNLYQIRTRLMARLRPLVENVLKEMDGGGPLSLHAYGSHSKTV